MRRWTFAVGGSVLCVCCVLPSYEGSDSRPGQAQGGNDAAAGTGGRSNSTDTMGGSKNSAGNVGAGGEAGAFETAGASGSDTMGGLGGTTSGGNGGSAVMGGSGGSSSGGNGGSGGNAGSAAGMAGSSGSGGVGGEGACPVGVLGHCDAGATYPLYPGYTLALVEDFPKSLDLDNDPIFTWSDGGPADGQTAFRREQLSFKNGKLVITAEQPAGCLPKTTNPGCIAPHMSYGEALSPNKLASLGTMGVWSGELRSRYNNYRYGHYEAKFSAPIANPGYEGTDNMAGDFLANLFVFRSPKNVKWTEIDIQLEAQHHDHVEGNVVNAMGAVGYPAGNAAPFDLPGGSGYAITQEHVYAFNWTPTKIEWFLDGKIIQTFAGSGNVPIPTDSAKIMLNLWVFSGNAFGDGVNNKYPFSFGVDYFRFYKLDTETTYPCANPPACLPTADKTQSAQNNPNELNYGM